jgi:tetratricopeptide (TPR) repeat protein
VKIVLTFIAVCVLMLAILAWHVISGGLFDAAPAKAVVLPPAPVLVERPATPDAVNEVPATLPDTAPSAVPAAQASVHWATDSAAEDARRRVAQAAEILRNEPNHPAALRDLAAALVALGRWDEAANTLARLVEVEPDDARLRFEQATVLIQSRRWIEALAALKAVVERTPDDARAWFNLALCHQAVGHLAEARSAWDRTITLQPSPAAFVRRGEVFLDLHEWSAAAADFERVLAQEPDASDATLNLSLALWKLGRTDEGRDRLLRFLETHPRQVPVFNRLAAIAWAECQSGTGDWRSSCAEAVAWCRRSLDCDPEQPELQELLESATKVAGK